MCQVRVHSRVGSEFTLVSGQNSFSSRVRVHSRVGSEFTLVSGQSSLSCQVRVHSRVRSKFILVSGQSSLSCQVRVHSVVRSKLLPSVRLGNKLSQKFVFDDNSSSCLTQSELLAQNHNCSVHPHAQDANVIPRIQTSYPGFKRHTQNTNIIHTKSHLRH